MDDASCHVLYSLWYCQVKSDISLQNSSSCSYNGDITIGGQNKFGAYLAQGSLTFLLGSMSSLIYHHWILHTRVSTDGQSLQNAFSLHKSTYEVLQTATSPESAENTSNSIINNSSLNQLILSPMPANNSEPWELFSEVFRKN